MLCPHCGNEIDPGEACPVCAAARERKRAAASDQERFCPGCGNTIYGAGACQICESGKVHHRRPSARAGLEFCARCGNEVEDKNDCPICKAGRASGKKLRLDEGPQCPQCQEVLENHELDGVMVLMCSSCQGCLFPPGGLEATLDKLRASGEGAELPAVLEEFRDRPGLRLPKTVRYKLCPVCQSAMNRKNYAAVSGIIVDLCGPHGTWVADHIFGELADFISRGGDLYAARFKHR